MSENGGSGRYKPRWSVVLPALLVTLFVVLTLQQRLQKWYLELTIESSVRAHIQLYYDIGNGLNATDAASFPLSQKEVETSVRFALPDGQIRYIRLDPLTRAGRFSLQQLTIRNVFNQILYEVQPEMIRPLQQIGPVSIQDNVLTAETISDANDPMMYLDLDYPIKNKGNSLVLAMVALISFICSYGFVVVSIRLLTSAIPKLKKHYFPESSGKNRSLNYILLFFSTGASIAFAGLLYTYIRSSPEGIVYQGQGSEYALSFYSSKGYKISKLNGQLKLTMDPFTIFRLYPNQRTMSYTINRKGFREGYVDLAAEQLAIVVGGSAAFGQGLINNEDTFASQLSRLNPNYTVLNAGVVGFLSGQELGYMVHYLDTYTPELYILFDGWNDVFDPYTSVNRWPMKGGPIGFNNSFFSIENELANKYKQDNTSDHSEKPLPGTGKTYRTEKKYFSAIQATYLDNIGKMFDFATARKAKLLVVFQPELGSKEVRSSIEQGLLKQWNTTYKYLDNEIPKKYGQLIKEAQSFCEQRGITYLDINKEPQFSHNPQTLFFDVVHPNEQGHKLIAESINAIIRTKFNSPGN